MTVPSLEEEGKKKKKESSRGTRKVMKFILKLCTWEVRTWHSCTHMPEILPGNLICEQQFEL